MSHLLPLGKPISLEQVLQRAQREGHSHEAVQADYARQVEAAVVHTIRIKPSVWRSFAVKAEAAGLSANAAVQLALQDWARR